MATDGSGERVPLGRGVHIRFSKDGRALFGGCNQDEIVPLVETWVRGSKGEERIRLEQWLEQKAKQDEEDRLEQRLRAQRAEIDAEVEKSTRKAKLLKGHEDVIRRHMYKERGLPENV